VSVVFENTKTESVRINWWQHNIN